MAPRVALVASCDHFNVVLHAFAASVGFGKLEDIGSAPPLENLMTDIGLGQFDEPCSTQPTLFPIWGWNR